MSQELITINGKIREKTGKTLAKHSRAAGNVPANLLEKGKATSIEIEGKLLGKAYKGGIGFNLAIGGQIKRVEIKEIQIDPLKRIPLHLDLVPAKG
jgi:ribosomal protein L25 (general stress protein Ctc)